MNTPVNRNADTVAIWDRLKTLDRPTLAELFARDGARVSKMSQRLEFDLGEAGPMGLLLDWSKTHLSDAELDAFEELAEVAGFGAAREALFDGGIVNPTEGRPATHGAMRGSGTESDVEEAQALLARMGMLVEAIHQGALGEVKHLIHIGIGGSALGPDLAVDALTRDLKLVDVHVVSNIDGLALEQAFAACDPQTTLIAVASKTFTTTETMT
ncbi:MAG: glucose-6-phosphate isomerase, partial [Pseudomonadota bacterium]